ncbi:hypothetical protein [Streptomyces sp. NPDC093225]|uniref:hypothetical protein n=1 Tax=Streptomyces sp. NPDC093225 TaxID=3366034 RepID=UPI003807EB98
METEAANLLVTGLGLDVQPSLLHPGGVCRRTTLRCPMCSQEVPMVQRLGTTVSDCRKCEGGVGFLHDPSRCWQRIH